MQLRAMSKAHPAALIIVDPAAPVGTWTHGIVWNIFAKAAALPEGAPRVEISTIEHARAGTISGASVVMAPSGNAHQYLFKLYVLDVTLDVKPGAGRNELEPAMKPHVLAEMG